MEIQLDVEMLDKIKVIANSLMGLDCVRALFAFFSLHILYTEELSVKIKNILP